MATTRSDWVVSSRTWTTQTIEIDASPQDIAAPLGGLYLIHPVADLSAIHQLYLALVAAGVTSPTVTITRSRKVKIAAGATFAIDWATGTQLRDLLGFAANLSGAASYVAPARSTLLWSGGKIASPREAPLDAVGRPHVDASVTIGPTGVQTVRQEGDPTVTNTFEWPRTRKARFWSDPINGVVAGDWRHFWGSEIITTQKLFILRRVTEGDDDDDADADYSVSYDVGPYVPNLSGREALTFRFARTLPTVEKFYEIELEVIQTAEFA
jgi:hypothetical protein